MGAYSFREDEPSLSELRGIRYLHFGGTEWIQGAMRVRRPTELVLAYTRQMMAWLLFAIPRPDSTLGILGLGAGSLLRYCFRHTPSKVATIERNERVTAMCDAYFPLPRSPRSLIHHCDAADWVSDWRNEGRCLALMVDLYDAHAEGPVCGSLEFYEGCRAVLEGQGIVAVNLFGNHESFAPNMAHIHAAFRDRVLELPEIDAGNRVVLGFRGPLPALDRQELQERARFLQTECGLPASKWVGDLWRELKRARLRCGEDT